MIGIHCSCPFDNEMQCLHVHMSYLILFVHLMIHRNTKLGQNTCINIYLHIYVCMYVRVVCRLLLEKYLVVEIQCSSEYFTFHEQICYTVSGLSLLRSVLLLLLIWCLFQVRYNNTHSIIASSGVEKIIKVRTTFSFNSLGNISPEIFSNHLKPTWQIYWHDRFYYIFTPQAALF